MVDRFFFKLIQPCAEGFTEKVGDCENSLGGVFFIRKFI